VRISYITINDLYIPRPHKKLETHQGSRWSFPTRFVFSCPLERLPEHDTSIPVCSETLTATRHSAYAVSGASRGPWLTWIALGPPAAQPYPYPATSTRCALIDPMSYGRSRDRQHQPGPRADRATPVTPRRPPRGPRPWWMPAPSLTVRSPDQPTGTHDNQRYRPAATALSMDMMMKPDDHGVKMVRHQADFQRHEQAKAERLERHSGAFACCVCLRPLPADCTSREEG
jgi:hypothetical protein